LSKLKRPSVGKRYLRLVCRGLLVVLIVFLGVGSFAVRDDTHHQSPLQAGSSAKTVVMLVIDSLSISDINHETMPNLTGLTETGSIGLMNTRTAKGRQPEGNLSTLMSQSVQGQGHKACRVQVFSLTLLRVLKVQRRLRSTYGTQINRFLPEKAL